VDGLNQPFGMAVLGSNFYVGNTDGVVVFQSDERVSYGRRVGVALGPDRRSLLMADDVGDVIWRVTGNDSA
jgi:glucose/arabinose dehydrogenase